MYKKIKMLICCLIFFGLSACSWIHKTEIVQGNVITPEMVSHLHTGMTEGEVKEVMGTPALVNIFTPNRIDYIYTYKMGKIQSRKRVILIFRNGRVSEIYQR